MSDDAPFEARVYDLYEDVYEEPRRLNYKDVAAAIGYWDDRLVDFAADAVALAATDARNDEPKRDREDVLESVLTWEE